MKVFQDNKKIILTNDENEILTKLSTDEAKQLVEKLVTAIEEEK
jgi:hypothetical protein